MSTAFFTHPDCEQHVTPEGHPEQVARLKAISKALSDAKFDGLIRRHAELATKEHINLAHPNHYYEHIKSSSPANGTIALDADTHMSPGTFQAALRAAGANVQAVDAVMGGEVQNAFCAMRPPGHHAETETPMGFCLFGSAVIGARHAINAYGAKRVAIVDFDVHHGNGTQDLVWNDENIFFASSHQMPLFPGSGHAHETGAHGNVLNCPLPAQSGRAEMQDVYDTEILPAIASFKPDLIIISAGFDAHMDDPLAGLNWQVNDFAWLTNRICDIADETCNGRVISTLEGGYDLNALALSVAAHLTVLMERGS